MDACPRMIVENITLRVRRTFVCFVVALVICLQFSKKRIREDAIVPLPNLFFFLFLKNGLGVTALEDQGTVDFQIFLLAFIQTLHDWLRSQHAIVDNISLIISAIIVLNTQCLKFFFLDEALIFGLIVFACLFIYRLLLRSDKTLGFHTFYL